MIDFKGMKKVAETAHRATFAHPNGHKIHIAKAALSPSMQKQISALPIHNFDEGGEALPEVAPQGQDSPPDAPGQVLPAAPSSGPGLPGGPLAVAEEAYAGPRQEGLEAAPATRSLASSPAPEEAPQAPADPNADINAMPGGAQALQAGQMQTDAVAQEAARNAKLQQDYATHQQAVEQDLHKSFADTTNTIQQVTHDIMTDKINPNHYLESLGSGSKISTAIGLILGGIGAAKAGGENPALQFLQSQIERDVEAQKANMGNKHNLLSALEHQYNDKATAAHLFAAIDANVLASKLASSASVAATPQAQAAQLQAVSQLKGQAAQYQRQAMLAGLRGSVEGQQPGVGMDARANAYLQAARVLDPKGAEEFEKRYIPNVGVARVPLESKDREFIQKNADLLDLLKRAETTVQKGGKLGPVTPSNRAEAASIQNQIHTRMGEIANLNRFTGEENKIYEKTIPDLVGTHLTGRDSTLVQQLIKSVHANQDTFYQQKGINRQAGDTDKVTVISPNGQSGSIPRPQLQQALAKGFKLLQ